MGKRNVFDGTCVHAEEEACPHYDNEGDLSHELEVLKETKCQRCEEAHKFLNEHDLPRTGHIWSVGSGKWSVKARIEMLIKKMSGE